MAETPGRLLRLLSLLQTPREWTGPELAERLEVSARTIRNDVDRLRTLGYPVEATRGRIGGYRLAAGTAMPPLLLEDDEAVAVALSLRTAASGGVAGVEETALRALVKLQQVLPRRLAGRVDAVQSYTVRAASNASRSSKVDAAALALMSGAAHDREILRFGYSDRAGADTERRVEPYRLANVGLRWYLVAWDVQRDDWRVFRVDRMSAVRSVGHRFRARELPDPDVAAWVARRTRAAVQTFTARLLIHASAEVVQERVGGWDRVIEPVADDLCILQVGAQSAADLAKWLTFIPADFEVLDSPELQAALDVFATRFARAAS